MPRSSSPPSAAPALHPRRRLALNDRPIAKNFPCAPVCLALLGLLVSAAFPSLSRAQGAPVYAVSQAGSSVKFFVKASVALAGTFDKWDATLTFASRQADSGALDIEIHAASVDTGSGLKNGKLKSKDFFDVKQNPLITFKSTKVWRTGPNTFEVDGNFTIRGVTRHEKLALSVFSDGPASGTIKGQMAFDRKDYGMNSGIPFIRIANRVEVDVDLRVKRLSGPPLIFRP